MFCCWSKTIYYYSNIIFRDSALKIIFNKCEFSNNIFIFCVKTNDICKLYSSQSNLFSPYSHGYIYQIHILSLFILYSGKFFYTLYTLYTRFQLTSSKINRYAKYADSNARCQTNNYPWKSVKRRRPVSRSFLEKMFIIAVMPPRDRGECVASD